MFKIGRNQLILAVALTLAAGSAQATALCYVDNYGYKWHLKLVKSTPTSEFYNGTMTNSAGKHGASALFNKDNNASSVGSDYGTSFHYNLKWSFNGASGSWINQDPNAGAHGKVTSFVACGSETASKVEEKSGPKTII